MKFPRVPFALFHRFTIALVVFLALAAYVYFYEIRYLQRKEKKTEEQKKVFTIPKKEITEMEFAYPDGERIVVRKTGEDWRLIAPLSVDASDQELEYLAGRAEEMKMKEKITEKNLEEFGLSHPALVVTIKDSHGKSEQVSFGKKAPVGWSVYARRGEDIFLTEEAFYTNFRVDVDKLRERRLFHFSSDSVQSLSIHTPEKSFTIQKEGDLLWLIEPERKPASRTAWDNFLRTLEYLEVSSFSTASVNPSALSLEPPLYTLSVTFSAKKEEQDGKKGKTKQPEKMETQEVLLGKKEGEEIWATRKGSNELVKVSYSSLRSLLENPEQAEKRVPLEVDSFEVSRITGSWEKKTFALEKRQEKWYRLRPQSAVVDWADLNDFLDSFALRPAERKEQKEKLTAPLQLEISFFDEKKKLIGTLHAGSQDNRLIFFNPAEKWEYAYSEADSAQFLSRFKKIAGFSEEKKSPSHKN
ncbi:MAG: DUF4340 domain-containing protein [bacterium JZ-2024 1]